MRPARLPPFPRFRRRRPQLPPMIDLAEVPPTTWGGIAATIFAAVIAYQSFPLGQALGFTMAVMAIVFGPRTYRLDRLTAAAYDLVEGDPPILNIEKWEARRKNWWRSRLKSLGMAIDYTYSDLARTAARKSKWVKLELRPRWTLWPREEHVTAVRVRIPPRVQIKRVEVLLAEALAEFFNCEVEDLSVTVTRQLRKNWLRFSPDTTLVDEATVEEERPTYADRARYVTVPADKWVEVPDHTAPIPTIPEDERAGG
jgi:hypothetical protein